MAALVWNDASSFFFCFLLLLLLLLLLFASFVTFLPSSFFLPSFFLLLVLFLSFFFIRVLWLVGRYLCGLPIRGFLIGRRRRPFVLQLRSGRVAMVTQFGLPRVFLIFLPSLFLSFVCVCVCVCLSSSSLFVWFSFFFSFLFVGQSPTRRHNKRRRR